MSVKDYGLRGIVDTKVVKTVFQALTAGAANAFAFAIQNPENQDVDLIDVTVVVTTAGGTATAVLDVGLVASATDTADGIMDGKDLNAAAVYRMDGDMAEGFDWKAAGGTNDYVTGKILVEAAASLVGKVAVTYAMTVQEGAGE